MVHERTGRIPLTTLVGGVGVALGSLYGVVLSAPDVLPLPREMVYAGNPTLELLSSAVLAVAYGVLAFGLPGESGIGGASILGQASLFVFGVHPLVLDLSALLSPGSAQPGAMIEGYASLAVAVVGLAAGLVAATAIVRAGQLHGYARWALLPVVVAMAATTAISLIPVQEVMMALFPLGAVSALASLVAGVAYALHGRARDIRSLARQLDEKW